MSYPAPISASNRVAPESHEAASAPKLCINCKCYRPWLSEVGETPLDKQAAFSRCAATVTETNEDLTLVDGRPLVVNHAYCEHNRRASGKCGIDATLFEAT